MRIRYLANFLDHRISAIDYSASSSSSSYLMCLFSRDVDDQLSHQCFGSRPSGLGMVFHFLRLLQADYHPCHLHTVSLLMLVC